MKDHILIVNTPDEDTEAYLSRFISQIRQTPELKDLPIQLLTRKYSDGLPSKITEFGVVHYDGKSESNECLNAVNVAEAQYIIVLAKRPQDDISDSLTFDVLTRIKEIGTQAIIAAESVDDLNRNRMLVAGAKTVMRPIRAYPELLVRAIVAPGTETVMENLFNHSGDHLARLDVVFTEKRWKDIIFVSVENNYGLPLAYIGSDGIVTNPNPNEVCSGTSIICMVKEGVHICVNDASNKLNSTA
jgi:voltage-gated potassium channel